MAESLDGEQLLRAAAQKHRVDLAILVAETAIWASPEAHRLIAGRTGAAAVYPDTRRCRAGRGEKVGQVVGDVRIDNNSWANHAVKSVLSWPRAQITGFEVCHIWPATAYDRRYHTALPNLVLLPRALAGLSDHDPHIGRVLQFKSYTLYGNWQPEGRRPPSRPVGFPERWREADGLGERARAFLERRIAKLTGQPLVQAGQAGVRDLTKYRFVGKTLAKGRLVQEVVRAYLRSEPPATMPDLKAIFPDHLQRGYGRVYGVVAEEAAALAATSGEKERFFVAPRDILTLADGSRIAVCSQWGARNVEAFIAHAATLGFEIEAARAGGE